MPIPPILHNNIPDRIRTCKTCVLSTVCIPKFHHRDITYTHKGTRTLKTLSLSQVCMPIPSCGHIIKAPSAYIQMVLIISTIYKSSKKIHYPEQSSLFISVRSKIRVFSDSRQRLNDNSLCRYDTAKQIRLFIVGNSFLIIFNVSCRSLFLYLLYYISFGLSTKPQVYFLSYNLCVCNTLFFLSPT